MLRQQLKVPAIFFCRDRAQKHNFAYTHILRNKKLGFTFGTTKALRNAFFNADKGATVKLEQENKISVNVPKPIRQVRFSADETQLLVATQGGIVLVYNVNDITTNVRYFEYVSPSVSKSFFNYNRRDKHLQFIHSA